MKFQVALDFFTLDEALRLMEMIHPYVDIAEIGSPLMYAEGFSAVAEMKKRYPQIQILADMKIVDGGFEIGDAAYKAGADIVTTIGVTNDETLYGLVRAAKENHKKAMADAINVADLKKRVQELDEMGFDYILLHTAHDTLGNASAPVEDLKELKGLVKRAELGISGGIKLSMMPEIVSAKPDWVVMGSGITLAENPLETAKSVKEYMRQQL